MLLEIRTSVQLLLQPQRRHCLLLQLICNQYDKEVEKQESDAALNCTSTVGLICWLRDLYIVFFG